MNDFATIQRGKRRGKGLITNLTDRKAVRDVSKANQASIAIAVGDFLFLDNGSPSFDRLVPLSVT